jgi:glycosyltransferase involved in cell wall biosynthesis
MKEGQKNTPLVTIITPTLNQGRFIEETIVSIREQDYPNIEHIVFDAGSTDNTLEILKKYEDGLTWFQAPDKGQSDAINKGFRMAKGEFVTWLNSDDTLLEGAITKAVNVLVENPDIKMVYGKGYLIDEDSNITGECPTEPYDIKRLAKYNYIYQPSALFRADIFETIGMLNEDLKYSMDLDLWIRIAQNFKIKYYPEFLSTYRLHPESKTMGQAMDFHKEEMETFKRYFGKAPSNWVYGYVRFKVAENHPSLQRVKPLFFFVVAINFLFEYIRQNGMFSVSKFAVIDKEVLRKLKKNWDELGRK